MAIPERLAIEEAFTHRGQRAQPPPKEQLQLPKNLTRTAVSAVTAGRSVVLVVGVDELDMGRQRSESFASMCTQETPVAGGHLP
ncbi:MAG: hypothetical protein Q8M01_06620 [Rubrivivax sp.]|nr:hypothetical protein [Rubrivivax sp.]